MTHSARWRRKILNVIFIRDPESGTLPSKPNAFNYQRVVRVRDADDSVENFIA
jgi:hypothetical protein